MEESVVEVPKILGDVFEAVVCAVFLDSGMNMELVWRVFRPMFMPFIGTVELLVLDPLLHTTKSLIR